MSVLDVLIEEHLLLYKFIGYLKRDGDEERASERLRGDLLAFFCALNRHEEFEELVFGGPGGITGPDPEGFLDQHRRLADLRADILAALKGSEGAVPPDLGACIAALAARLREHFAWEEQVLWPLRTPGGPASEIDLENRASRELQLLTAEVEKYGIRLSEPSGSKKP